ncbi:MAG: DUF4870 domain-containing protein, partial [Chloroflexota bacterium]
LSAIALGMGIVLPVIGWSEQRRKSNYASFQCLQALGYQSLGYTVWILVTLVVLLFSIITSIAGVINVENLQTEVTRVVFAHTLLMFGLVGVYFALPIIAAIACALGKDFRYPIMGNRLAHYLGYNVGVEQVWLIEEHEDRWVTAMGHFSVIIALWGMLAPLTAGILQGKRSLFLKIQSVQTLVYQAGVMLLLIGAGFIYIIGLAVLGAVVGFSEQANSAPPIAALVVFFIFMLIAFVIILIVPLFQSMGQWAGYRVLKGDDYRYPLLGNLVEKRLRSTSGFQTPMEHIEEKSK